MVKKFKKLFELLDRKFNNFSETIKCAVEEIGKNSVKPSIIPNNILFPIINHSFSK